MKTAERSGFLATEWLRRLAAVGSLLGSVAALAACGGHHRHVYGNDEALAIAPGLSATVEGDQIVFDQNQVDRYIATHQTSETDIKMHTLRGDSQEIQITTNLAITGGALWNIAEKRISMACNPPGEKDCFLVVKSDKTSYLYPKNSPNDGTLGKLTRIDKMMQIFEIKTPDAPGPNEMPA